MEDMTKNFAIQKKIALKLSKRNEIGEKPTLMILQ